MQRPSGATRHTASATSARRETSSGSKNDEPDGLAELLAAVFLAVGSHVEPGGAFYLAAPAGPLGTVFRQQLDAAGWRFHEALVWVKDVFVLGHSDYHYRHEDVLYGHLPGEGRPGRGRHAGTRWRGDNAQDSVFEVARPKRSEDHPCMKPVGLIAAQLAELAQARRERPRPVRGQRQHTDRSRNARRARLPRRARPRLLRRDPAALRRLHRPGRVRALMARPSKFTAERQEKILEALRAGNYLETAAAYAAISYQTLNEWRKTFPEFSEAVEKARADAEARMVAVIMKAAPSSWQAAAWWLKRSFPDRYGRRTRIDADVKVTAKPVVDVSKLTLDEQRSLLELLRKGAPSETELPRRPRPALKLMPGEAAA